MEYRGNIYFDAALSQQYVRDLCEAHEIIVESITEIAEITIFSFWGGSDSTDSLKFLLKDLSLQGCHLIKGYLYDDEDGGCELVTALDGSVESFYCDAEIYDFISYMDEERINESNELLEVSQNSPRSLFESKLAWWSEGLELSSIKALKKIIENTISEAESYCEE